MGPVKIATIFAKFVFGPAEFTPFSLGSVPVLVRDGTVQFVLFMLHGGAVAPKFGLRGMRLRGSGHDQSGKGESGEKLAVHRLILNVGHVGDLADPPKLPPGT